MPGPVQSIERAAAVLRLLAGRRSLGLVEVASALGLAKGTTHGILTTLRGVGFVEQDRASGRYRLGAELFTLSGSGMDPNELRSRATNLADALAARSGQAVRVAVLTDDGQVEIVHHVFRQDNTPQVLEVGLRVPGHATALGQVLLAYDLSGSTAERRLVPYTHRTVTDSGIWRRTLVETRARGWATVREEWKPGEAAIAAPLRAQGGLVVGAIGLAGRTERICGPKGAPLGALVTLVGDIARSISRELGDTR
jgi:DNA-binding IclR family transcriptional regulator